MANAKDAIKEMLDSKGVKFQMLNGCIEGVKARKGVTFIEFGTTCVDVMEAVEQKDKVGIILWVSREAYEEAQSK